MSGRNAEPDHKRARIDWYFDYVSPFAYLQSRRLDEVAALADIRLRPVLFAGLLRHWQHKGPAEIPGKQLLTYRHAHWLAKRMGVPYRMPEHHPFNPLAALRLTLALGCRREVVDTISNVIGGDGLRPDSEAGWRAILDRLGVSDAEALIDAPETKAALMRNYEEAVQAQIFGVPSFIAGGELFWGVDCTDMLLDFLKNPRLFDEPGMAGLAGITASSIRRL